MIYHDVEQGSDSWFALRRGIPTASEFSRIITPAKGLTGGQGSKSYIAQLIGETMAIHLPANVQTYTSRSMEHGRDFEPEARRYYSLERNLDVCNGGFCQTDCRRFGASPDGIITLESFSAFTSCMGALELKCPQPATHAEYLMDGGLPVEYKWQVHGHLVVTEAMWCDFLSYCPGLPPLLIRVTPDEDTEKLRAALNDFYQRFQVALAKIRAA